MKDARIYRLRRWPYRFVGIITLWSFLFSCLSDNYFVYTAYARTAVSVENGLSGTKTGLSSVSPDTGPDSLINLKSLDMHNFSIPGYLALVESAWSPEKARGRKKIIHIKDAHCNYACQKKISSIIKHLYREYGIHMINLEGGAGKYDLSIFGFIEEGDIREKVSDHFVKEGILNGATYFAINNPDKIRLWGVEDSELYLKNLRIYQDSVYDRSRASACLDDIDLALTGLKKRIFTKKLLELDTKYNRYKSNDIKLDEYLQYLAEYAKSLGIDIKTFKNIFLLNQALKIEKKIDFKKAEAERFDLVNKLQNILSKYEFEELIMKSVEFKAQKISEHDFHQYLIKKTKEVGYGLDDNSNLKRYIIYLSLYAAVDKLRTNSDLIRLENFLRDKSFENETQKELDTLSRNLVLLKNMFGVTLKKCDFDEYRRDPEAFSIGRYIEFIRDHHPGYDLDDDIRLVDMIREDIVEFYDCSFSRDKAFLDNMKYQEKVNEDGVVTDEISIIITGGFHSENLHKLFRENNIAYVSLVPKFTNDKSYECPYFRLLSGKRFETDNKLSTLLGSSIAVADILTKLGVSVHGPDAVRLLRFKAGLEAYMQRHKLTALMLTNGGQQVHVNSDLRVISPQEYADIRDYNERRVESLDIDPSATAAGYLVKKTAQEPGQQARFDLINAILTVLISSIHTVTASINANLGYSGFITFASIFPIIFITASLHEIAHYIILLHVGAKNVDMGVDFKGLKVDHIYEMGDPHVVRKELSSLLGPPALHIFLADVALITMLNFGRANPFISTIAAELVVANILMFLVHILPFSTDGVMLWGLTFSAKYRKRFRDKYLSGPVSYSDVRTGLMSEVPPLDVKDGQSDHFVGLRLKDADKRKDFTKGDADKKAAAARKKGLYNIPGVNLLEDGEEINVFKMTMEDHDRICAALDLKNGGLGLMIRSIIDNMGYERIDISAIKKKGIIISFLEKNASKYMFEDCRDNGFIGINETFLSVASRNIKVARCLFKLGLIHELLHEAGVEGLDENYELESRMTRKILADDVLSLREFEDALYGKVELASAFIKELRKRFYEFHIARNMDGFIKLGIWRKTTDGSTGIPFEFGYVHNKTTGVYETVGEASNTFAVEGKYPGILAAMAEAAPTEKEGAVLRAKYEQFLEYEKAYAHQGVEDNIFYYMEGLNETPYSTQWKAAVYYFLMKVNPLAGLKFKISDFENARFNIYEDERLSEPYPYMAFDDNTWGTGRLGDRLMNTTGEGILFGPMRVLSPRLRGMCVDIGNDRIGVLPQHGVDRKEGTLLHEAFHRETIKLTKRLRIPNTNIERMILCELYSRTANYGDGSEWLNASGILGTDAHYQIPKDELPALQKKLGRMRGNFHSAAGGRASNLKAADVRLIILTAILAGCQIDSVIKIFDILNRITDPKAMIALLEKISSSLGKKWENVFTARDMAVEFMDILDAFTMFRRNKARAPYLAARIEWSKQRDVYYDLVMDLLKGHDMKKEQYIECVMLCRKLKAIHDDIERQDTVLAKAFQKAVYAVAQMEMSSSEWHKSGFDQYRDVKWHNFTHSANNTIEAVACLRNMNAGGTAVESKVYALTAIASICHDVGYYSGDGSFGSVKTIKPGHEQRSINFIRNYGNRLGIISEGDRALIGLIMAGTKTRISAGKWNGLEKDARGAADIRKLRDGIRKMSEYRYGEERSIPLASRADRDILVGAVLGAKALATLDIYDTRQNAVSAIYGLHDEFKRDHQILSVFLRDKVVDRANYDELISRLKQEGLTDTEIMDRVRQALPEGRFDLVSRALVEMSNIFLMPSGDEQVSATRGFYLGFADKRVNELGVWDYVSDEAKARFSKTRSQIEELYAKSYTGDVYTKAKDVVPSVVDCMRKAAPTYVLEAATSIDTNDPVFGYLRKTEKALGKDGHNIHARRYLALDNWVERLTGSEEEPIEQDQTLSNMLKLFSSDLNKPSLSGKTRLLIRVVQGEDDNDSVEDKMERLKDYIIGKLSEDDLLGDHQLAEKTFRENIRFVPVNIGCARYLNTVIDLITDIAALEIDRYESGAYSGGIPDSLKNGFLELLKNSIDNYKEIKEGAESIGEILGKVFGQGGFILQIKAIDWEEIRDWKRANDKILESL